MLRRRFHTSEPKRTREQKNVELGEIYRYHTTWHTRWAMGRNRNRWERGRLGTTYISPRTFFRVGRFLHALNSYSVQHCLRYGDLWLVGSGLKGGSVPMHTSLTLIFGRICHKWFGSQKTYHNISRTSINRAIKLKNNERSHRSLHIPYGVLGSMDLLYSQWVMTNDT